MIFKDVDQPSTRRRKEEGRRAEGGGRGEEDGQGARRRRKEVEGRRWRKGERRGGERAADVIE